MDERNNVVEFKPVKKRYPTPEEVKRILTEDDEEYYEEESGLEEKILTTKVFINMPFYVRILALTFIIIYLACFATVFLGWCIFQEKSHWVIGAVVALMIMARWKHVYNFGRKKQQFFTLTITNSLIICGILPRYNVEVMSSNQFVKEHRVSSLTDVGSMFKEFEKEEKENERKGIDKWIEGIEISYIFRDATITKSKNYIVLRDGENEIVMPYNKNALEFLETVALIRD